MNAKNSTLSAAITAKLTEIVARPLTPRSLLELEQTARLARELLAVGANPTSYPSRTMGSLQPLAIEGGLYDTPGGGLTTLSGFGQSTNAETFGSNIIREAIAAFGAFKKGEQSLPAPDPKLDPMTTVSAIVEAEKNGEKTIAEALRAQLIAQTQSAPGPLALPVKEVPS